MAGASPTLSSHPGALGGWGELPDLLCPFIPDRKARPKLWTRWREPQGRWESNDLQPRPGSRASCPSHRRWEGGGRSGGQCPQNWP